MRRVFEAPSVLFSGDLLAETGWRIRVANALEVDPCAVHLIGSACTGFSLDPTRNFEEFSVGSDIDVAVVSHLHFEIAWRHLRTLGATRYGMDAKALAAFKDIRRDLAYYGVIPTENILGWLPFGRTWAEALERISKDAPIGGHDLSVRLYRDTYALVLYQERTAELLRDKILTPSVRE